MIPIPDVDFIQEIWDADGAVHRFEDGEWKLVHPPRRKLRVVNKFRKQLNESLSETVRLRTRLHNLKLVRGLCLVMAFTLFAIALYAIMR